MAKSVGRKVFRSNVSQRKRKARKAAKVVLVIIVLAVLVFLGYCVANPVFEYFADRGGDSSLAEETKPWTPPVSKDESDNSGDSDSNAGEDSDSGSDNREEQKKPEAGRFSAYRLPVTAMTSSSALTEALSTAKEGG